MKRHFILLTSALCILLLLYSLPALSAVEIKVGGTGSALATMRAVADAFEKENPGVKVTVLPSLGSTGGIKAVLKGAIDIAVSSIELTESERREGAKQTEYAKSPFIFVTNKKNVSNITIEEVIKIYEGYMTSWPDNSRIRLIMRSEKDTANFILAGISPRMKEAVAVALKRQGLITAVTDQENAETLESIPGSFGTLTLDQMISEKLSLKTLSLNGIDPTVKALSQGAYKVYKTYYAVTTDRTSETAKKFISYLRNKGSRILARNGYLVTGN